MRSSVHISQKGKMRRRHKKDEEEITLVSARYAHDFIIELTFTSKDVTHTTFKNFLPLFQEYLKGDNLKYFAPANFKKFIVKNGNIYWGKNEDVVFPSSMLFDETIAKGDSSEEILYII